MANFTAQIDEWVRATEQRMTAVWKESAQRVISLSVSLVPVDTGFLRASIRASNETMPSIDPAASGQKGGSYSFDGSDITTTIVGAQLGGTIYAGYTANYALMVNYGTSRMEPRRFVDMAAIQWPKIVSEVVEEAKARVYGVHS